MRFPFFTRSELRSSSILRRRRSRPNRRAWVAEDLEGRLLLAASIFTVTDTSSSTADIGSLPFAIKQVNLNTSPDGSAAKVALSRSSPFAPRKDEHLALVEVRASRLHP